MSNEIKDLVQHFAAGHDVVALPSVVDAEDRRLRMMLVHLILLRLAVVIRFVLVGGRRQQDTAKASLTDGRTSVPADARAEGHGGSGDVRQATRPIRLPAGHRPPPSRCSIACAIAGAPVYQSNVRLGGGMRRWTRKLAAAGVVLVAAGCGTQAVSTGTSQSSGDSGVTAIRPIHPLPGATPAEKQTYEQALQSYCRLVPRDPECP